MVALQEEYLVGLEELREEDSRLEGRVLQSERQRIRRHSKVAEEPWSTKEQQNRRCHDTVATKLSFEMEESQVNPCQKKEMREITCEDGSPLPEAAGDVSAVTDSSIVEESLS
ncbi:hypothetical protein YC2023_109724 [Brassica napus]